MTKAQKADQDAARNELREILKPGMEILCILRHVSRSGMFRVIDLKVIVNGELRGLTWTVARAMGWKHDKRDGIGTTGCGMDMGFHLVYNLGATLYPTGFRCIGDHCPSNDHSNRETRKFHPSGGYALRSRWV